MKIGIFTAMYKEARTFLRGDVKKTDVGAFGIYSFKLGMHDAFLCSPPNVGEIAAAAACQLLISQFKVDVILNFGVVGALTQSMSVLSEVLVGSVVHYDFDVSAIDSVPVGRYANFENVAVECDQNMLGKALSFRKLPIVRCASGDKFISEADKKRFLNSEFSADICDMESAGILITCKYNNIPCLLVKCISDSLNNTLNDYETNTNAASQNFFHFAEEIVSLL